MKKTLWDVSKPQKVLFAVENDEIHLKNLVQLHLLKITGSQFVLAGRIKLNVMIFEDARTLENAKIGKSETNRI